MDVKQLKTEGYVTIQYPGTIKAIVSDALASWQQFCALPEDLKIKLSNDDRTNDFGYMRRKDKGPRSDSKEMFHLKRAILPELLERAQAITDSRAIEYIQAVDTLIEAIQPTVEQFARSIEQEYNLPNLTKDMLAYQDRWTFRFLHYFGGDVLAHPHADRGGFTLHLHETANGGEYLDFNGVWHPWPISGEQTIIFPGMKLQHRSGSELKALWHRVTATEETRQQGRYAIVAFVEFDWTHVIDTEHHRMQDLSPGFNYSTVPSEFEKLFIAS